MHEYKCWEGSHEKIEKKIMSLQYQKYNLIVLYRNRISHNRSDESYIFSPLFTASMEFALFWLSAKTFCLTLNMFGGETYFETMTALFSFVTCRVQPPVQSHAVCDGSEDPDRGLPLLSGVPDYHWLRFPVHHRGVSCGHCPAHLSAGHHNGLGDIYHRYLPRKGTRAVCLYTSQVTGIHSHVCPSPVIGSRVFQQRRSLVSSTLTLVKLKDTDFFWSCFSSNWTLSPPAEEFAMSIIACTVHLCLVIYCKSTGLFFCPFNGTLSLQSLPLEGQRDLHLFRECEALWN